MMNFRILLVEDDPLWEGILKERIQIAVQDMNSASLTVEVATSFEEATIALRQQSPFHLLVTDIELAASEFGKEMGKELVDRACHLQIPTLVVSGTLTPSDTRDFLQDYKVYDVFPKSDFASRRKLFTSRVQEILSRGHERITKAMASDLSLPTNDSPSSGNLTALKRQQLETQQTHLQSEWQTRNKKLAALRDASILETAADQKFRLKTQIESEEQEIKRLENELSKLEQALNPS